ncbi:membrane protein [Streptomyces xanthochromogenes]
MTKLLLCLHVLAAVLAVGPVTVAASMFPQALRRAHSAPDDPEALATLRTLHRICRVYAGIGMAVPLFGFATASSLGVLGSGWLITSIVLTAAAAAVLGLLILPAQDNALTAAQVAGPNPAARLAMLTGVFNLLWATVTVLMIVRPGSTTGA